MRRARVSSQWLVDNCLRKRQKVETSGTSFEDGQAGERCEFDEVDLFELESGPEIDAEVGTSSRMVLMRCLHVPEADPIDLEVAVACLFKHHLDNLFSQARSKQGTKRKAREWEKQANRGDGVEDL